MPTDLGDLIFVRVTADESTPNEMRAYDGVLLGLTQQAIDTMPTGVDTIRVAGITVPGYKRTVDGQAQWVIAPLPDPNVVMLESLPGQGGWKNQGAKKVWADIGMELLRRGVPGHDLRSGFPRLFAAAKAEALAQTAPAAPKP